MWFLRQAGRQAHGPQVQVPSHPVLSPSCGLVIATVESLGKDFPAQDWQLPCALFSHLTQTRSSPLAV